MFCLFIQAWMLALGLYCTLLSMDAHFQCLFKCEYLLLAFTIPFQVQMLIFPVYSSINACSWPLPYLFECKCLFHIFLPVWMLALNLYCTLSSMSAHFIYSFMCEHLLSSSMIFFWSWTLIFHSLCSFKCDHSFNAS